MQGSTLHFCFPKFEIFSTYRLGIFCLQNPNPGSKFFVLNLENEKNFTSHSNSVMEIFQRTARLSVKCNF